MLRMFCLNNSNQIGLNLCIECGMFFYVKYMCLVWCIVIIRTNRAYCVHISSINVWMMCSFVHNTHLNLGLGRNDCFYAFRIYIYREICATNNDDNLCCHNHPSLLLYSFIIANYIIEHHDVFGNWTAAMKRIAIWLNRRRAMRHQNVI